MTQFLVSSSPENLNAALAPFARTVTVEAEFGDTLVEGSVATLAHHGPRAGNPAPCLAPNGFASEVEAVGLSHLDLDALGGCLAVLGQRPEDPEFWDLAAFVDVRGPHRIAESGASPRCVAALHAWWAWNDEHRTFPPRDGSVLDVTSDVEAASVALAAILAGDEALLAQGEQRRQTESQLNADTFVERVEGVIVRVGSSFSNHLYTTPTGEQGRAVVALNPRLGSITVSFADPPSGLTAREIVQELWGPEAGGHAGIAGSPRGRRMSLADLMAAVTRVALT